jgi:hypothetical protein
MFALDSNWREKEENNGGEEIKRYEEIRKK